ncbi:MAG: transcription termination/antitermination factor NusG, partial [Planctomycetota bacterium]
MSEETPQATTEATDLDVPKEEPMVTDGMDWFVLRVASNKEDSVRRTLLRKIKIEGYDGSDEAKPWLVNRILVPT